MAKLTIKKLGGADEHRPFKAHGFMDFFRLGEATVGHFTFEPGWRWSQDVRPIAGTKTCQASHLVCSLSGRLHVKMDDGTESDLVAGDLAFIPPGHDAWVVGDHAFTGIDFGTIEDYARARAGMGAGAEQPPAH
jgi:quercetin dioxygenase-like cupin family protein